MTETLHTAQPSRRTIVKGAAWAAPVIAVAVATPAAAASEGNPADELDFFLTAGEVIGTATASGSVRSNGVRISPSDPNDPKVVAAGTVFQITVTYNGSNPDFSFLNVPFPYGSVEAMKGQNPAWDNIEVTENKIVFTATTPFDTSEPTVGSIQWDIDPNNRPEDNSISFTGVATLAPGGDFPNGGTLTNLIIDPNAGTGALSGPTPESWPSA
ncbi:hypothetical protein ACSAGD_11280 [Paramicrobacterium sp. CJ85]|uniref:hypothetical protein n=1 Tax=Paramicrobacterium sp. CJ85 TaxID=3445355 RepID=UPI003F5E19B0